MPLIGFSYAPEILALRNYSGVTKAGSGCSVAYDDSVLGSANGSQHRLKYCKNRCIVGSAVLHRFVYILKCIEVLSKLSSIDFELLHHTQNKSIRKK